MRRDQFRSVNRMLGSQPCIGPFPASLVIPFLAISVVFLISGRFFEWSWLAILLSICWALATWWLVTQGINWIFLSRFYRLFFTPNWCRRHRHYHSLIDSDMSDKRCKPGSDHS